ncbi:protein translocase subunit SecD [Blochmannia endosymbiont of Camponotus modoc]|uniref:protein translocase subunit SecD n=1 Tax=Blochmannia endosymbiont of Camponotus modoc TaxID=2945587 RepID=UPI0020247FFA|nr:protein translocase subunit SecD [Blochmannia endosymbiont of Camponotus modoc]URJ29220.1 protein translocase subunit SecD [Blochmannia endosymbiont of Camponotus modoc]
MLNNYPLWKYLVVILVFVTSIIYTLPNLYRDHPTIYIVPCALEQNYQEMDDILLCQIKQILTYEEIINKSIVLQANKIRIQFFHEQDQLQAYQKLATIFSKKYQILLCSTPNIPHWLSVIKAKPIKLGLDLCGGIYFVIHANTKTVLDKFQEQYISSLRAILFEKNIPYLKIYKIKNHDIEINFQNSNYRNQAILPLSEVDNDLILHAMGTNKLHVIFSERKKNAIRENTIHKNCTILHHRIHQLGITEPLVQRHGSDRIIIELPGFRDIEKIREMLGTTASLEFRLVNSAISEFEINNNLIPEDSEIKLSNNGYLIPLYKRIVLSGDNIIHSNVSLDEYNRPQVNISLDKTGSISISNFTKNNIGKAIATLFVEYKDNGKKDSKGHVILIKHEKVINIATIQSQLSDNFRISGINNLNEARHLSLLLRMGNLAAPIHIEEERMIGPTLGKQNIVRGFTACALGLLISICFMILWYRYFGLIASVALIANLILMISTMSIIPGIVLTMPSIVGIILTLSVAVDANVLINERIKEEIKQGKPVQYAIYTGYRKAFTSIVDANITTIITSIILYLIGTGPIKGFAITTVIGVGTSMFTSIVGTRAVVNLIYGKRRINKLSI